MNRSNTGCPVDGTCFCTGACRDDTWPGIEPDPWKYDPFDNDEDKGGWASSTLDFTNMIYFAVSQYDVEGNSEALRFITNQGASIEEFWDEGDGYVLLSAQSPPNLQKWDSNGVPVLAIDISLASLKTQITGNNA